EKVLSAQHGAVLTGLVTSKERSCGSGGQSVLMIYGLIAPASTIKATGEFHTSQDLNAVSRHHKEWVTDLLVDILTEMALPQPEQTAALIQVMLDGMIVNASIFHDMEHIDSVWMTLAQLIGLKPQPLDKEGEADWQ
ncbi:hypothetical protein, partial [Litchfieldella qijiaojingensis]|uniref:hypothetical protein n=1 Tax=Litchfieldella qijiaojingensis TaxID=980347 RepID=UPI001E3B7636